MQKKSTKKKHQNYDANFKAEALRQLQYGRSVPEVARSSEISEHLLRKWRSEQRAQMSAVELAIQAEIERLQKQVRALENERDILEKSLLIIGQKP